MTIILVVFSAFAVSIGVLAAGEAAILLFDLWWSRLDRWWSRRAHR